jgi:hypothetical protein
LFCLFLVCLVKKKGRKIITPALPVESGTASAKQAEYEPYS